MGNKNNKFEAYWDWLTWITNYKKAYKSIPTIAELRIKGETIHGLVQQYWKRWGI